MENKLSTSLKMLDRDQAPEAEKEPLAGAEYVKVPDGEYQTQIINYKYNKYPQFNSKKDKSCGRRIILVHCIIDGPHMGIELEQYFPCYDTFSNHTAYYQAYVMMNDGLPPKRKSRMSPGIFKNAICRVQVRSTKKKFKNNQVKPEYLQYSKVDEILEVLHKDGGAG